MEARCKLCHNKAPFTYQINKMAPFRYGFAYFLILNFFKTRAHLLVLFSSISVDAFCLHTSQDSRGAIIQLRAYSAVPAYLCMEQNGVFTIGGK